MKFMQIFCLVLFSIFSSFVMSYIALATMIGPWMGPTLILFGIIISSSFKYIAPYDMLLPVIGGSIGGIIATAISSALATYYFIDKAFFIEWARNPISMISFISALSITAGLFGLWIVQYIQKSLIEEQKLSFPIGKLVYDVSLSNNKDNSKKQLILGIFFTCMYSLINTFLRIKTSWYNGTIQLLRSRSIGFFSIPAIRFDMELFPMFVSIGFIAGHLMTFPLLVGTIARITVVDTIRTMWFMHVSDSDYILAFCSGMILIGALISLIETPKKLWNFLSTTQHGSISFFSFKEFFKISTLIILILMTGFFSYLKFSFLSQIYAVIFTVLCTYQLAVIAGKIGMAFLGRFATFIMMPGIFLFNFNPFQATVIATFFEICGGVSAELLFGKKTAQLAHLDEKKVKIFQICGIALGAISVAIAFWFLVTHFELGSEQLFAQRAQGRALLIQAGTFDMHVLIVGALFGLILHICKVNTMLVLGGFLMSLSMIIPLVFGGILSLFFNKKERFEPLCSGIYATVSIWMIITALLGR